MRGMVEDVGVPRERDRHPARQPQPAPARGVRQRTSSTRRTSTGSPRGRCASPATTPARCRACRRATTSSSARSTSCGGRGARSRCGRTPITHHLRRAGVTTMLVSDHPHLFETGGENYHTDFSAWEYVRGHEGDPWQTAPDPSWIGAPGAAGARGLDPPPLRHDAGRGSATRPTSPGRGRWPRRPRGSRDSAGRTIASSCSSTSSIRTSRSTRPSRGRRATTPTGTGRTRRSGRRTRSARVAEGRSSPSARRAHIRANYGAKLSMIDHWFGGVLDAIDAQDLWDDTAVIVCTDHGHYLGEQRHLRQARRAGLRALGHIPLLSSWPGVDAGRGRRADDERRPARDAVPTCSASTPEHRTHGARSSR